MSSISATDNNPTPPFHHIPSSLPEEESMTNALIESIVIKNFVLLLASLAQHLSSAKQSTGESHQGKSITEWMAKTERLLDSFNSQASLMDNLSSIRSITQPILALYIHMLIEREMQPLMNKIKTLEEKIETLRSRISSTPPQAPFHWGDSTLLA